MIIYFILTVFYLFSVLKLNQTLYLGLILFPLQRSWWLHLKEPKIDQKWDFSLYFYSVLHIFRSEIESNPISRSDVVSSTKNMVTALGRAQKRSKMCFFTLFLQCNFILYIFSDLKLNQTLYLGLILLPPRTLWRLHLKEPKKISKMWFFTLFLQCSTYFQIWNWIKSYI